MMFSSIRVLTRLRPHSSSYIITRSISANVTITRPIIHTWARYQSTTTESIIAPPTNDTSTSTTSSSSTTITSATDPSNDPVATELAATTPESATTTSTDPITDTPNESSTTATTESTSDDTTLESSSSTTTTPTKSFDLKDKDLIIARSKTVFMPYRNVPRWFEHKLSSFGKIIDAFSVSTSKGLRIFVTYQHEATAYRAYQFFSNNQYKCGQVLLKLTKDRKEPFRLIPLMPLRTLSDKRRVELTIPLTEPLKQHLQQYGNVEVYGLIGKNAAMAVFDTEDAAVAAVEKTPQPFQFQTGVVHVNVSEDLLKEAPSRTKRTENKSQKVQSQTNDPSKPKSLWNETIDPATGRPYYWHTKTREVTWERPAELGPKP